MTPPKTNLAYLLPVCLVATLGGLLFGYDTGVISGAIEPLTARFSLTPEMKGWVFFTSIAHREATWAGEPFQQIVLGGLAWAMGNLDVDVPPSLHRVTPEVEAAVPA